eukprot:CAMPEP_0197566922 /NCGR_PEP_ID=MMETSP1320-20131121/34745_1 /TAXON_ID=91990 /ORGANISM="Bolidomonas sp., Strain RCC2347" /LENGTH=53 /DNA_ID=CAMNT_0043129059 /DNA_START=157 /DNA_END=315 /DNA_ORIENTATION=+
MEHQNLVSYTDVHLPRGTLDPVELISPLHGLRELLDPDVAVALGVDGLYDAAN